MNGTVEHHQVRFTTQRAELRRKLLERLDDRIDEAVRVGTAAALLAEPEQTAARMIAALPVADSFDQVIGPFYDIAGAMSVLDISKSAVIKRLDRRNVIGGQLRDRSRNWVFPTWQFNDRGELIDGMTGVWKVLLREADPWTAMTWMRTRSSDLDGMSVVDWLTAGHPATTAIDLALHRVQQWAA